MNFKIPPIEDYYIRQSRENIHPSKLHRMESMIETQNREEKAPAPLSAAPQHHPTHNRSSGRLWGIIGLIAVMGTLLWTYLQLRE
jgi:hypothetical protein